MNNLTTGSIPLFRIVGIQVYLHWTWLLIAYFEIVNRVNRYQSMIWNVIEYLALFGIVLMHEFGHALACRQVGGQANRIMLWPLGGVAFVQPPPRHMTIPSPSTPRLRKTALPAGRAWRRFGAGGAAMIGIYGLRLDSAADAQGGSAGGVS